MKHYPRIRKTVKWTSAAMVVVLVVLWAVSLKWRVMWLGSSYRMSLEQNCLFILRAGLFSPADAGLHVLRNNPGAGNRWVGMWVSVDWQRPLGRVVLPIWTLMIPAGVIFALLHRHDRRMSHTLREGLCPKCGYDHTGLKDANAACPECGTPPPPPAS